MTHRVDPKFTSNNFQILSLEILSNKILFAVTLRRLFDGLPASTLAESSKLLARKQQTSVVTPPVFADILDPPFKEQNLRWNYFHSPFIDQTLFRRIQSR